MGNGALPHGPSYRAHPRLYLKSPAVAMAEGLFAEVLRKIMRVVPQDVCENDLSLIDRK
jgi:hypothetical protein